MTAVLLGEGVLTWEAEERRSDRYGAVWLMRGQDDATDIPLAVDGLQGRTGTLTVEVVATRRSGHIGDLFRGIFPSTPNIGDVIVLGTGELFTENGRVGLHPADGRTTDWLDPHALYRTHDQTVRLTFEDTP